MTMDPLGPAEPAEVRLRDGSRTVLRRIRPDDKDRLQRGLELLSERSRYLRFHAPIDHLTRAQLRYLTEVDHHDHVAWLALDPDDPASPGMGVARYVRLADEPDVAEAAVTVLDRYQGRGVGTVLLAVLARTAVAHGVRVFRNYVLAENQAMLELFEQLGGVRRHAPGPVECVDLPLPEKPEDLPDTPAGRVFRRIASQQMPAPLVTFPPVWPSADGHEPSGPSEG